MGVAEEIVVLIKYYGCCRRNSGAHQTLWVLQKKYWCSSSTMGVAEEIVVLIKYSPKRENILGCIKEQVEFESKPEKKANDIAKLSLT